MKKQRKTKRQDLVWIRMSLNQHQYQGQQADLTNIWDQMRNTGPMGVLQKIMKIFK